MTENIEGRAVDRIPLDNVTPGDTAFMARGPESVILQHGGVVTRMRYRTVETMSLDTFRTQVVPRLKLDKSERALYELRDTLDGTVTLMLDDQVIKYNLASMEECGLEDFAKLLKEEARAKDVVVTTPDLPWSLVAKVQNANRRCITIRLPEERRRYYMPLYRVSVDIWYPPLWACVKMPANGGTAHGMCLAIEKAFNMDWRKTELLQLPMPNVFDNDGSICYGDVSLATALNGLVTDAQVIMSMLNMFFNSEFNDHLMEYYDFKSIAEQAYNALPVDRTYKDLIDEHYAIADFLKMLRVLKEKNGWRTLKYRPYKQTVEEFVHLV